MSDIDLIRQINVLEQRLDDLVKPEVGQWVSWTPTLDQGGAVSITITYARYITSFNLVVVQVRVAITGSGVAGNAIVIGNIPSAIQPTNTATSTSVIGTGTIFESGVGFHGSILVAFAANGWRLTEPGVSDWVGVTPNFALSNGDELGFMAAYER